MPRVDHGTTPLQLGAQLKVALAQERSSMHASHELTLLWKSCSDAALFLQRVSHAPTS